MFKLYDRIWADAILTQKAKKNERTNWKLYTIVPISLLQGVNLFTMFYWLKKLVNHSLPLVFNVDIFNARLINASLSVVITFFIPFAILNYLFIFSNNRYEALLVKYKLRHKGLYKKYVLYSVGALAIPIILQKMFL
jgi:hypothetical protein